ncbi:hypothetical protein B0H14DRAFT_3856417 [Mycena olivaceomarginata]|nr:hypothetical protein B0H14DRAFT_3898201 [Mycena olivaceomarginata]KAJ7887318.1 hypothetical protein B0H14DRAFT_3856417 [Mycena olivaceomarginata]
MSTSDYSSTPTSAFHVLPPESAALHVAHAFTLGMDKANFIPGPRIPWTPSSFYLGLRALTGTHRPVPAPHAAAGRTTVHGRYTASPHRRLPSRRWPRHVRPSHSEYSPQSRSHFRCPPHPSARGHSGKRIYHGSVAHGVYTNAILPSTRPKPATLRCPVLVSTPNTTLNSARVARHLALCYNTTTVLRRPLPSPYPFPLVHAVSSLRCCDKPALTAVHTHAVLLFTPDTRLWGGGGNSTTTPAAKSGRLETDTLS